MKNNGLFLVIAVILFISAVYVLSTPSITGFLTRTGQFTTGNVVPVVEAIYLNDVELTSTPTDVVITGVENSTKSVTVKIKVKDENGNCDEFENGVAILCDGDVTCTDDNAKYIIDDLEYDAADGQWGTGDIYCNLTGTATNIQFYEVNGTWSAFANATDTIDTGSFNNRWTWNEIRAITYPASGSTVDLGSLALNAWNDGRGGQLMQNAGNIISTLAWNATTFTGGTYADTLALDGTNFIIDDDGVRGTSGGGIEPQVNISATPTTQVDFYPALGLLNCSSVACSNENATIQVHWHINVPYGLHSDTYTDTIEVATADFE